MPPFDDSAGAARAALTLQQLMQSLPGAMHLLAGDASQLEIARVAEAPATGPASLPQTLYLVPDTEAARGAGWLAQRADLVLLAPAEAAELILNLPGRRAAVVQVNGPRVPLDLAARVQRALLDPKGEGLAAGSVAVARQDLLHDVLHQRFHDPQAALSRARNLGVELESARVVLVCAIDDFERFYSQHAHEGEPFIQRIKGGLLLLVREEVGRQDPRGVVVSMGDAVVALLSDAEQAKEAAAGIAGRSRRQVGYVPVSVATGTAKDDWKQLAGSFREAQLALELRRRLRLRPRHVTFSELTGAALLQLLDGVQEVNELLMAELAPLIEADRAHRSRLIETLAAWHDAGTSLKGAADTLGVHPKTLRYRLDRIADLLGPGAMEGDKRLLYYLAARWWLWNQS